MRCSGCQQPFSSRSLGSLGRHAVLEGIQPGTVAGAGAHVSQIARPVLPQHRLSIFRIVLPPDRLPHFQVNLSAENYWRIDDACRLELLNVLVDAARKISATVHFVFPWRRANIADPVAPRNGSECSTMEGAGQSSSVPRMKAAIYSRYGPRTLSKSGIAKVIRCLSEVYVRREIIITLET